MRTDVFLGRTLTSDFLVKVLTDATPEQIAKVRRLYERPGTLGEKEAARQALLRYGVSEHEVKPQPLQNEKNRYKYYRVVLEYTVEGKTLTWEPTNGHILATDEISAEAQARKYFSQYWKQQKMGSRIPETRARTTRVKE